MRRTPTALRWLLWVGWALGGCGGAPDALPADLQARLNTSTAPAAARTHLQAGLKALLADDLGSASMAFNRGLEVDPHHPHLNFLNALVYDLQAEAGDTAKAELAEVGYLLTLNFDANHWLAAYHLARLYAREGRLQEAQNEFARALLTRPNHEPSAFGLAAVSYDLGEPEVATAALNRIATQRPAVLRAKAMVNAALGDDLSAVQQLDAYAHQEPDAWAARQATERVGAWRALYAQADRPAGDAGGGAGSDAGGEEEKAEENQQSAKKTPPLMVVLDAVIISQQIGEGSSHGIDLLSALQVQFGGTLIDASRSTTRDVATGSYTEFTDSRKSGFSISMPAITYSLAIANAQDSFSEIVARPSVIAHHEKESEVFIGSELTYVVTGGDRGGGSFTKEVGLRLKVRPEFLGQGRLRLEVETQLQSFAPSATPGSFEQAVLTNTNRTTATVELVFGQTLALSAGNSSQTIEVSGGIPLLRDIPIIQYFFSNSRKSVVQTTTLILITPRRPTTEDAAGALHGLSTALERSKHPKAPETLRALQARHRDWFAPTPNTLVAMHALLGTEIQREFRRGDIQFAGIDDLEEPEQESPQQPIPRHRRVLRDLVDFLYF